MDKSLLFEKVIFKEKDKWLPRIMSIPEARNDIERVYNHDLSIRIINDYVSKFESFKFDFISLLLMIPSIICTGISTVIQNIFSRRREFHPCIRIVELRENSASQTSLEIPGEVEEEFGEAYKYITKRKTNFFTGRLSRDIIKIFIKMLKTKPQYSYTAVTVFAHLCFINRLIHECSPKAIITFESENDCASSLVTFFCERHGIEYINIMHGETWITPMHFNVRFSRFYVWDFFYVKQYETLKCTTSMFRVYKPIRFRLDIPDYDGEKSFATYYLQGQGFDELVIIRDALRKLCREGRVCKIRLHPRATDHKLVETVFKNSSIIIENYNDVDIIQSYASTEYIISSFSTVLTEALENGLKCVIDDLSNADTYKALKELMYINAERIHLKLSDLIKVS